MTDNLKLKLLSPAGSEDIAYAAFDAGADAVYIGPKGWSRRISDYEVDDAAIKRCIEYANERGKEVHIPLNNYYQDTQLNTLMQKIDKYISWGATLIIVTDVGLMNRIHEKYPGFRLCTSVSTGPSNAEAVQFYKDMGCSQFVAQMNATPEDIARIKEKVDIIIEVFAHGFYDFNQCGRCWMSTYAGQRKEINDDGESYYFDGSVNRGGGCYRICHRDWNLHNGDEIIIKKDSFKGYLYPVYRLDLLAEYVRAGARYFKIQGRTYGKEVITAMTGLYRKILDEIAADPDDFKPSEADFEEQRNIEELRIRQQKKRTDGLVRKVGMR